MDLPRAECLRDLDKWEALTEINQMVRNGPTNTTPTADLVEAEEE